MNGLHFGGIVFLALVFLAGAWTSAKYPGVNLIGRVTG